MIESIRTWLRHRFSGAEEVPPPSLRATASYRQRLVKAENAAPRVKLEKIDVEPQAHGTIESLGPGKNVYVRSPYVREDLGTHESLKIVDESLLEGEEPAGIDPYNTGRFDKARKWDQRSRK